MIRQCPMVIFNADGILRTGGDDPGSGVRVVSNNTYTPHKRRTISRSKFIINYKL